MAAHIGEVLAYLQQVFWQASEERLHVFYCDAAGRVLCDRTVAHGVADGLRMRSRELLSEAFAVEATGLLLAHNHPSGICRPSEADIRSTRRLATLCREVDIELLDHFILTQDRGFSMRGGGFL